MGGFYHGGASNSDSYVVLAGGGYKSVSDFLLSQDHYKTSPGAGTAGTSSATSGSTLSVPYVTVNANGHVTAYGTHTHTISGFLTAQDHYKTSPGAGTAGTSSATSGSTLSVPYVTINANGHVTGYGTHTHTISGFLTALDHYKTSPGAGTAGTSSATSGATPSIPYVTVNANGHVTGYGTHTHSITAVVGSYTSNGGKLNPNYFGTNRVGFLMMNTTVNSNSQYKDWIIMDCYNGNDVGGGVAIGVNRQSLGAYIMRSAAARTSWAESAELIGTHNYTTYCATADHTHAYLPLAGGTMDSGAVIDRGGYSNMWVNGRKNPMIKTTSYPGYSAILSMKTTNGSWDLGVYDDDYAYLTYITDTKYNAGTNDIGYQLKFPKKNDTLAVLGDITNTWRKVQLDGVNKLGSGTNTNPLNIKAGTGMSITESNGTFTFACTVTAGDVYWKDVKDKIRHDNEFNIVPSGYNSTMWFNYRSDADTNVTVSQYILGNGSAGYAALTCANITCLAIDSYGITPRSNDSYSLGTMSKRWTWGYYTSGLVVGPTDYTGPHTSYEGTWIQRGWIEMSATSPYIDFHMKNTSGYFATVNSNDYKARLILWLDKARLLTEYDISSHYTGGYIANTEGSLANTVCLGVISIYREDATSGTWYCLNNHGLVTAEVLYLPLDSYYTQSSGPAYLQRGLIIKVKPYYTWDNEYSTRNTKVNVAFAIGSVQSRWWGNNNVNHRAIHGRTEGTERNTAYGSFQIGVVGTDSVTPGTTNPGKRGPDTGNVLVITAYRPNGANDNDNIGDVLFDGLLETGNGSIASFRVAIFGYMT